MKEKMFLKLDGVSPVDNRPSKKFAKKMHITLDTRHMTCVVTEILKLMEPLTHIRAKFSRICESLTFERATKNYDSFSYLG